MVSVPSLSSSNKALQIGGGNRQVNNMTRHTGDDYEKALQIIEQTQGVKLKRVDKDAKMKRHGRSIDNGDREQHVREPGLHINSTQKQRFSRVNSQGSANSLRDERKVSTAHRKDNTLKSIEQSRGMNMSSRVDPSNSSALSRAQPSNSKSRLNTMSSIAPSAISGRRNNVPQLNLNESSPHPKTPNSPPQRSLKQNASSPNYNDEDNMPKETNFNNDRSKPKVNDVDDCSNSSSFYVLLIRILLT
jgi:hypothetical protein